MKFSVLVAIVPEENEQAAIDTCLLYTSWGRWNNRHVSPGNQ